MFFLVFGLFENIAHLFLKIQLKQAQINFHCVFSFYLSSNHALSGTAQKIYNFCSFDLILISGQPRFRVSSEFVLNF